MQVANDDKLAVESFINMERGRENSLIKFSLLDESLRNGWRIVSELRYVSDDMGSNEFREPTELESKLISVAMDKYAHKEDLC